MMAALPRYTACRYCGGLNGAGATVLLRGPASVPCCAKGGCQGKAMREQPIDLAALETEAARMGAEHGLAAASWVFDGNTDHDEYLAVLRGIEAGDPAIMDRLPGSPLSGEFADSPTPASVLTELAGKSYAELLGDAADDLLRAYEDAFTESSQDEIERVARYHTTTVQTIAKEASGYFVKRTRDGGDSWLICLKDDRPEWLQTLVFDAHDRMFPDDWKYAVIENAVDFISASDDPGMASGEFADSQVDDFNSDRLAWLASSGYRQGYCDDAAEEFGIGNDAGIIDRIGLGQYFEASEVYASVLRSLEARVEEVIS